MTVYDDEDSRCREIARGKPVDGHSDPKDLFLLQFPLKNSLPNKGASWYDVSIGGGGRSRKSGRSKGGCVNFVVPKSDQNVDKGGEGQKIRNFCGRHIWKLPKWALLYTCQTLLNIGSSRVLGFGDHHVGNGTGPGGRLTGIFPPLAGFVTHPGCIWGSLGLNTDHSSQYVDH